MPFEVEILINKKFEKQLLKWRHQKMNYLKSNKILKEYNPLIDIFSTSKNKFTKNYFITKSKSVPMIENGENKSSFTVVKNKDGKVIRRYWVKSIYSKEIFVKEHTEAQWHKRIYDLKSKEIVDALKIKKLNIKTPEFIARIRIPKQGVIISAFEKTDFVPITKLIKLVSKNEREKLLNKTKQLGIKLIKANALPSVFRSNEILISKTTPRKFMLTDTAIGMYPISRNKLFLLKELESNKKILLPDWKQIENNYKEFSKYWNKLPKKVRKTVQLNILDSILNEIKTGKKDNIETIRQNINLLVHKIFSKKQW